MPSISPSLKESLIFRAILLTLLIIVALKPVVVRPDAGAPAAWAILVDTSRSMRVKDPVMRLEQAKLIARDIFKKAPASKLFSFSDGATRISLKEIDSLSPTGKKSDMGQAIRAAFAKESFRGMVVLSDGRHVGAGDPVAEAASIGRPFLLIGTGDKTLFKDVAVKSIQSPPFAFKNIQTSLSATLAVVGFPKQKITVSLKEGDKVLAVQTIEVTSAEVETTVTFSWIPTRLGSKILTVQAGAYAGEVTTLNNRKDVRLDVGRDRFRVLYICGQPGPEYGFLRYQFKSDPAVELVTFVILRNAANIVTASEAELSLIPFPTQDVLIQQLPTFDLVVFEQFAYRQFGLLPDVMFAIRKKVEEGGSFLLSGDVPVFSKGSDYDVALIRDMLPVELAPMGTPVIEKPFTLQIKAPTHPVVRMETHQRFSALHGYFPVPSAKPGALVIGAVQDGGRDIPVLTTWAFGKGRVAALTTRSTWRWAMESGGGIYQQFWKNMVLWLTHSNEFKPVRLSVDGNDVRLGETGMMRVWVYDDYFKPISDAHVQILLEGPEGLKKSMTPHQETTGVFVASFESQLLGSYRARAWVDRKGKRLGEDSVSFRVVESHFEDEDLSPNPGLLKEIAQSSNGKFLTAQEFTPDIFEQFNEDVTRSVGKKVLVWNSPWILFLILVFFIGEWVFRKRKGLP